MFFYISPVCVVLPLPYMISGVLNEHPRVAMAYRDSADRDKFVDFYDKVTSPEVTLAPASK